MKLWLMFFVLAALSGCVGTPVTNAGCAVYGTQRVYMPQLGADAVSRWVDVLDGAMTGACR